MCLLRLLLAVWKTSYVPLLIRLQLNAGQEAKMVRISVLSDALKTM